MKRNACFFCSQYSLDHILHPVLDLLLEDRCQLTGVILVGDLPYEKWLSAGLAQPGEEVTVGTPDSSLHHAKRLPKEHLVSILRFLGWEWQTVIMNYKGIAKKARTFTAMVKKQWSRLARAVVQVLSLVDFKIGQNKIWAAFSHLMAETALSRELPRDPLRSNLTFSVLIL